MRYLILAIFLLTGCASQTIETFQPFSPKEEMKDNKAYQADLITCQLEAKEYLSGRSGLDGNQIASEALQKGFSNLGTGIASPTVPGVYALGGASSEALSELGLSAQDVKKVLAWCLHDHGVASGAYHIYDPNL